MAQALSAVHDAQTGDPLSALKVGERGTADVSPFGRTAAELEVLLGPVFSPPLDDAHELRPWPLRRTIAFILITSGLFWALAFALVYWLI